MLTVKMKRILYCVILLVIILPQFTSAQSRKAERAYSSFKAGEYYDAIDNFKNTYSKTKDKELKAEMVFYGGRELPSYQRSEKC